MSLYTVSSRPRSLADLVSTPVLPEGPDGDRAVLVPGLRTHHHPGAQIMFTFRLARPVPGEPR